MSIKILALNADYLFLSSSMILTVAFKQYRVTSILTISRVVQLH